jgi:hypothetical protein
MPNSILDAIKLGLWDFEPEQVPPTHYDPTGSLPGSQGKLEALAERARLGLPLWHDRDRLYYDDKTEA